MNYNQHLYCLDINSNPMVYHRSARLDMEESTLSFEVEVLSSELDNKDRSKMTRKHAELRFINEIITGLEEYKKKYYE